MKIKHSIEFSKYLLKYGINLVRYPFMSDSAIFADIYRKKIWSHHGAISGDGSTSDATQAICAKLPELLKNYSINSILDIPCGDFSWIQHIDMESINYIGADIVPELIEKNITDFKDCENRKFQVLDICSDPLPEVDLIFCRDCLVHLSNKKIGAALANIRKSGSKYLMMTTFPDRQRNFNMLTGAWRPLNFEKSPFNLNPPLEILNEECMIRNGRFPDKSLGLWKISDCV